MAQDHSFDIVSRIEMQEVLFQAGIPMSFMNYR